MAQNDTIMRIPLRDRLMRNNNMVLIAGPLVLPSRADFVSVLRQLAARGPAARLGYTYEGGEAWHYDPATAADVCDAMVTTTDEDDPAKLIDLAAVLSQAETVYPMRYVLTPTHIVEVYHHTLGDAYFAFATLEAIFALLRGDETHWGMQPEVSWPTLRSAWSRLLRQPANLRRAYAAKRYTGDNTPAGPLTRITGQAQLLQVATTPESTRALNIAARQQGASINVIMFDAIRRALAAEGIADTITCATYDMRDYLPAGTHAGGNFIAALPFSAEALLSPVRMTQEQRHNSETALPLLAATVGSIKGTLLRQRVTGTIWYAPAAGARLVFSGIGTVRAIERLPWQKGAEPFYACYVNPGEGKEIATNIIKLKNRMIVSTTMYPEVHDLPAVRRALTLVAANPLVYLTEPVPING